MKDVCGEVGEKKFAWVWIEVAFPSAFCILLLYNSVGAGLQQGRRAGTIGGGD